MKRTDSKLKYYGFTLIELLVTIAIIGILAATVMRMSANSKKKAINSNIQSSLAQLATLAADIDRLSTGDENESNCSLLFADPDMQRLINFAAEEAGREVVYTYCSKDTNDYLYTFIAPKVEGDGTYYCVDQNAGVREVEYSNLNSILTDYSCSSVAAEADEPTNPLTIVSAVYNGQSITITFNQNVFYQSSSNSGYSPVVISTYNNNLALVEEEQNFVGELPYLNGTNEVTFSFSSPILCTVSNNPWGSYSQDSHYMNINDVYGVESGTVGSMSASITCPAPTGSCTGSMDNFMGCSATDAWSCSSVEMCTWTANPDTCIGTPSRSCNTTTQSECGIGCMWVDELGGYCTIDNSYTCESVGYTNCSSVSGCYQITGQGGTCSRNSITCSNFSGSNCPTQYGCTVNWN